MTNEEAIKKLKEQQAEFNDTYVDFAGVNEAYNLAIKALEARPKGDLISREALKNEVRKHSEYYADRTEEDRYNVGYTECACEVLDIIDNIPTVEPMGSEYGAIQYSNGFNDGFTTAKDTIIHNIAKQYSEHNELVPEWLSIGDLKGGAQ